jgi:outer membrane lipoprotein-sorting protein
MKKKMERHRQTRRLLGTGIMVSITACGLVCAAVPRPARANGLSANAILEKMEEAGKHIKGLKAGFHQTRTYALFDDKSDSLGTLYFKKPAKMLWQYQSPDKNSIYISEKQALMYLPDIKQVQKISLLRDRKTESLLIGFGNSAEEIQRNFNVEVLPPKNGCQVLDLTPKRKEISSQFQKLRLAINPENWLPHTIERFEPGGDTTVFTFSNIDTNVKLKDNFFEFKIPKDAEVVEY